MTDPDKLAAIARDVRAIAKAIDTGTLRVYVALDPATEEPSDLFDRLLELADQIDMLRLPIVVTHPEPKS